METCRKRTQALKTAAEPWCAFMVFYLLLFCDATQIADELDENKSPSRDLSPVTESSGPPTGAELPGATGVSRSHTLPSVKGSIKDTPSDDKQQRARVLKKQKRASSHQPRKTGSVDTS